MVKTTTGKIVLGGICLALTVIFLYASSLVPGLELTMYAISSFFVAIMILEFGIGGGLLVYVAAAILGFILLPNKLALIPYIFLYGYYGIVKYLIEKLVTPAQQLLVKMVFFGVVLGIGLYGFKELLLGAISIPEATTPVLVVGGVCIMILYDFIFTQLVNLYVKRIQRKGADNVKLD